MERLKEVLSRTLQIEKDKISDETSPDNVETWDSFNGLMLVSELEKVFNVKFSMEEVTSTRNVKDIKESLRKHGVELYE